MVVYKQAYKNSCGAACLLCAALELGVTTLPRWDDYLFLSAGDVPLARAPESEAPIYQVTSDNPRHGQPERWGSSMPSSVIRCAKHMGLGVSALREPTALSRVLCAIYSGEMKRILAEGVSITNLAGQDAEPRRPLVRRERELVVLVGVRFHNLGLLHWVVRRPDGSVMEPRMGVDHPSLEAAEAATGMRRCGLSLVVSAPAKVARVEPRRLDDGLGAWPVTQMNKARAEALVT